MAKRKKVSKTTQEYNKELKRIKQFISRAEKRGYIFPENIIPNRPKRITSKSVQRLKNLKADTLYRKARYVDTETGEVIRGEVGRERERSESAKRAAATRKAKKEAERRFFTESERVYEEPTKDDFDRVRANNFIDMLLERLGTPITSYFIISSGQLRRRRVEVVALAEAGRNRILNLLNAAIASEGKEAFGNRINKYADRINDLIDILMYSSDGTMVSSAIAELATIINGSMLTVEDSISISSLEEYYEDWTEV